ncbi:MAG: helix-turn-helix transcriptional regulator [Peptostreptococcaceae bacterium]|nr:helix-turn-helix transcriptional regulator [Peptostreptococcaceae bacterium]
MKPLNYAILKHFTKVKGACADDVIEALKGKYGNFKAFKKNSVISALMTAEANGLIEEKSCDMDKSGNLRIYYHANDEGAATINNFIKD